MEKKAKIILLIFLLIISIGALGYFVIYPNLNTTSTAAKTSDTPSKIVDNSKNNIDPNNVGTNLTAGQSLLSGQYIQNGTFKLIYQSDNNLVYYNDTSPIWASNTEIKTPNKMSFNGNINVIDSTNTVNYSTSVTEGTLLNIDSAGLLTIQDTNKVVLWTASSSNSGTPASTPAPQVDTGCTGVSGKYSFNLNDTLNANQTLKQCEGIQNSNKQFKLVMQSDGNLVSYDTNSTNPIKTWESNSGGKGAGPYVTNFQDDGNIVVVASGNNTIWSLNSKIPNARSDRKLVIGDDGKTRLTYKSGNDNSINTYWTSF